MKTEGKLMSSQFNIKKLFCGFQRELKIVQRNNNSEVSGKTQSSN